MSEFQLRQDWPALGVEQGQIAMTERDWHWTARIVATDDPNLRRINLMVKTADIPVRNLETLVAYVEKPFDRE